MFAKGLLLLALAASSVDAEPRVVRIDPSAETIPATTLRFYITFDRPARDRVEQQSLLLTTDDGTAVRAPFMDFGPELWSADGRRLTVLIDPGRIKRDVEAPGASEAPLREGRSYVLQFGAFRHRFQIGPPLRQAIDPSQWEVTPPGISSPSLRIGFGRVMDAALLRSQLTVLTPDGAPIEGTVSLSDGETHWSFLPRAPMPPGSYRIHVGAALEDVSGNRVSEALDHDVGSTEAPAPSFDIPFIVASQQGAGLPPACQPQIYRAEEDCRDLALRAATLNGLDRLRYIPLRSASLTLGGEVRFRSEAFDAPNFGIGAGDQRYLSRGFRVYAHGDIRNASGWRAFVQLAGGDETGRKPSERPFDRSAPDVQQAFLEMPLPIGGTRSFVRIGRQELNLGGTRLVSVRDQANLRLAFDMALVKLQPRSIELSAFWGRPVMNRSGAFDDTAPASETFFGAMARVRPTLFGAPAVLDALALGRNRDRAIFVDASGAERRRTVALRLSGQAGAIDYLVSTSYQFGTIAASRISAYGIAATVGYRFDKIVFAPRIGIDAGIASGDRQRGDGRLNSYDPLYPNLGYFTDAPVDNPINWRGVQPSITFEPTKKLQIKTGADIRYRASRKDGVYATNGRPLIGATAAASRYVDTLAYMRTTWRPTRHVQVDAAYVHGSAGRTVTAAGGRDLDFGLLQLAYRF
jgi:Alginate export